MKDEQDNFGYMDAKSALEVLQWAVDRYAPDLALACSFSVEDIVTAHMLKTQWPEARVFALDTGRMNEETYSCAEAVRRELNLDIAWYFPQREAVERLEQKRGLYSFKESLAMRHECCGIRKVEPLNRALSGLKGWITGLRREQGITRAGLRHVEPDAAHEGIIKVNPLAYWTSEQVWAYARQHHLPYNRLHDQGYPSIGCAPCTRAVAPGEDPRAGRWWWEEPEAKECGLHNRGTKP